MRTPILNSRFLSRLLALVLFANSACKSDPIEIEPSTPIVVPNTYDFDNVNFSAKTDRINQLSKMIEYMETANKEGTTLQLGVLKDMFSNTNGNGNAYFSFTSAKMLRDKCFEPDITSIESYFQKAVEAGPGWLLNRWGRARYLYKATGDTAAQIRDFEWVLAQDPYLAEGPVFWNLFCQRDARQQLDRLRAD